MTSDWSVLQLEYLIQIYHGLDTCTLDSEMVGIFVPFYLYYRKTSDRSGVPHFFDCLLLAK